MAIQKIVGLSFNPVSHPKVKVGVPVTIEHDKENEYSSRAIVVKCGGGVVTLGHIGEKGNLKHEEIFEALPLKGTIHTMSRLKDGEEFANFKPGEITHCEIEFPMASDAAADGLTKSFNEEGVSVKFLEQEHRYIHDSKELVSATRYIKRWIKPFDKDMVSSMCASSYGCSQQEVLDLWDGGGSVSAGFGTSIHNALEHYENHKQLGETIQQKKDGPFNKALPTHPLLRKIVEDFYRQDLRQGEEVVTEALLTNVERGLCGFADRILVLSKKEKRCIVQDYKVNIEADKENKYTKYLGQMAILPKNKLSKYQMQMSFYARLLELSGWTVEGLTAFVYEDEWKKYDMEVLKLDF